MSPVRSDITFLEILKKLKKEQDHPQIAPQRSIFAILPLHEIIFGWGIDTPKLFGSDQIDSGLTVPHGHVAVQPDIILLQDIFIVVEAQTTPPLESNPVTNCPLGQLHPIHVPVDPGAPSFPAGPWSP
jgi:hypothetical protein